MFGADESLTQKSIANNIRAINAMIDVGIPKLHASLSAMYYVKGRCVLAVAIAPVQAPDTLVYGSCDGAMTIIQKKKINQLVTTLARQLNLKDHVVIELSSAKGFTMCTGADVQGHLGTDNLYYLLSLNRLLPPRAPRSSDENPSYRSDVWWRQYRPEFIKHYCVNLALSSDAYTGFGFDNSQVHHQEIVQAEEILINKVVPIVAEDLIQSIIPDRESDLKLISKTFHNRGLNLQYLGAVYLKCMEIEQATAIIPEEPIEDILLRVMVVRTVKNLFRKWMRQSNLSESQLINVFLHQLLHPKLQDEFWERILIPAVQVIRFFTFNIF